MDRRNLLAAGIAGTLLAPAAAARIVRAPGEPDASIKLWPGEAPGLLNSALDDHVWERSTDPAVRNRAMDRVRNPRLDVIRAANPNGAALLVMPGGGYSRIGVDHEGYDIGGWLAAQGVTVFVLFYRLPGEGWQDRMNTPLADAQRAMRLIKSQAGKWRIDPQRVAAMGFSAGGHLCADLATRFARKVYQPVDAADALDAGPMLAAPIYPVISMDPAIAHAGSRNLLLGSNPAPEAMAEHSPDLQVNAATPPSFLVHAEDDKTVPVENSLRFRAALKAAKIPVETHLFEKGGHGFGIRGASNRPAAGWPGLFQSWAKSQGLMG